MNWFKRMLHVHEWETKSLFGTQEWINPYFNKSFTEEGYFTLRTCKECGEKNAYFENKLGDRKEMAVRYMEDTMIKYKDYYEIRET